MRYGALTIGPLITFTVALAGDSTRPRPSGVDSTAAPADTVSNARPGGHGKSTAMMGRSAAGTRRWHVQRSPRGGEYASNFRYYSARENLDILIESTRAGPGRLEDLRKSAISAPLLAISLGYPTSLMGPDVSAPVGTRPHHYHGVPVLLRQPMDGGAGSWHGIDQMCEDNPRLTPMFDRFAQRIGKRRDHTVTALSYDTARLIAEGIARANLLTPKGLKEGLEKVRLLPAVNGGPRTHMSLGPYDHKAYKGDWLVVRHIAAGKTVFVELYDPEMRHHESRSSSLSARGCGRYSSATTSGRSTPAVLASRSSTRRRRRQRSHRKVIYPLPSAAAANRSSCQNVRANRGYDYVMLRGGLMGSVALEPLGPNRTQLRSCESVISARRSALVRGPSRFINAERGIDARCDGVLQRHPSFIGRTTPSHGRNRHHRGTRGSRAIPAPLCPLW